MKFIGKVVRSSWRISPGKNIAVLAAVMISACCSILAPFFLGQGISALSSAGTGARFFPLAMQIGCIYSTLWLAGSAFRYLLYPIYGSLEQELQSKVMANSLFDSLVADPAARSKSDNGEVSFAIDTEAGAYRDTLAGTYLSVFPAVLSLLAGVITTTLASSWREGLILICSIVLYTLVSRWLIDGHQKAQAAFFKESMRSFGVLGNSLSLWKETAVTRVPDFLTTRYLQDRISVEKAGTGSYIATRRLYVTQAVLLGATILALFVSISLRANSANAEVLGAIISTVGIAVAAITPLQSVGFGISSLAVAITQEREAGEKIRFSTSPDLSESPWHEGVCSLARLVKENDNSRRPIWVLGPSGTGKTTVLEGLLGLNGLGCEDVTFNAIDTSARAYAQQTPGLLNATARDNVTFGRALATELADEALCKIGLEEFAAGNPSAGRDVAGQDGGVSGGERQRIALARALCASANSLVVLDEPTSGLDSNSKARVWAYIEEEAKHKMIIVATHDEAAPILEGDAAFRPQIQLDSVN